MSDDQKQSPEQTIPVDAIIEAARKLNSAPVPTKGRIIVTVDDDGNQVMLST